MLWFPPDPHNLLGFALEPRLAKSHRFADYSLNAETLPHRETRGEERRGEKRREDRTGGEEGTEGKVVHADTHA